MRAITITIALLFVSTSTLTACDDDDDGDDAPVVSDAAPPAPPPDPVVATATRLVEEGRQIFRYDTFGDEVFWGTTLRLHEAVATITPAQALGLGLKVDVDALPREVVDALTAGQVDLNDPAVTATLLRVNAVIGVTGFFNGDTLESMGIQCALCHSTVDNSLAPGVGHRLDGWPNRDLNVGAIIAAAPDLSAFANLLDVDQATVRTVLNSWGPGKFDAELILDGRAFQPNGDTAATLLPAAYGLGGVDGHTYTGWGSVPYWNAFVANLEMGGQGNFWDPRLENASKFPIAAANNFGNKRSPVDKITPKLAALQFYQLALEAPVPPAGSFDAAAAARGEALFNGAAQCARCHMPPIYTEAGWNRHTPAEIGIDGFQASRSPDDTYRTTPLKGAWSRSTGGYYHDGRFPTLAAVVDHYDAHFELGLTAAQKADLVEFVKSL